MKTDLSNLIGSPEQNEAFRALYADIPSACRRYNGIAEAFSRFFAGTPSFFSASGRCEVIGNHTDHNGGRVMAAGISLDTVAAALPTDNMRVRMISQGFDGCFEADLSRLEPINAEKGTTTALIRGVAARFKQLGLNIGGFDAYVSSNVLRGSGLSSSASVEVLICTVLSHFYNSGAVTPEVMGEISQYAENVYFGKPCGLMDQLACACGGMVHIDFGSEKADIKRLSYDFSRRGYCMIITDVHEDHASLTDNYAEIIGDMRSAAEYFGAKRLIDVPQGAFYEAIPQIRKTAGDRAVLRALHFYEENLRVDKAAAALAANDLSGFFAQINASGESSARLLQNLCIPGSRAQAVPLALALSAKLLGGRGAARVHGGGFGGTVLAFVPADLKEDYISLMNRTFGENAALCLSVRSLPACRVL